jgi:hypothetical protein
VLDFQFYKVEYSPLERQDWALIGTDVSRTPVENGRLAVWQTTRVPEGSYQLRLRVVDPSGNYCEALVSPVRVASARPTETPLPPTPTEIVELTVVPPQATPTSPVVIPRDVLPLSSTPGALPPRAQPIGLGTPDLLVTGAFFFLGVCGMSGIVLFIAIFTYVRNQRW